MSIRMMTRVWDHSKQKGSGLVLALALADFADDAGYCWPGIHTLAKKARISERQTIRLIQKMEEEDELRVARRKYHGNRYWLTIDTGVAEGKMQCCKCRLPAGPGFEVNEHHIIPEKHGGDDEEDNLLLLCENCHYALHNLVDITLRDLIEGVETQGANLTHRQAVDGILGVTSTVLRVPRKSYDPLSNRHSTIIESLDSGAKKVAPPSLEEDDGRDEAEWLKKSRIEGESALDDMTQEERAKVASPVAQAPAGNSDNPGWRESMRGHIRTTPGDFTPDDILDYCQRFYDHTKNPPPAYGKGSIRWRTGATETLTEFHAAMLTVYSAVEKNLPSLDTQRRVFKLCVDVFFTNHTGYDHISASTPRSLASSMPDLMGTLKEIHDFYHMRGTLPNEGHIREWAQLRKDGKLERPTQADEGVRADPEQRERDMAAARQVVSRTT